VKKDLDYLIKIGFDITKTDKKGIIMERQKTLYDIHLEGEITEKETIELKGDYKLPPRLMEEIEDSKKNGFFYMMYLGGDTWKLGQTKKLTQRLYSLKNGMPLYPKITYFVVSDKFKEIEDFLKKKNKKNRIKNEFYSLSEDEVEKIHRFLKKLGCSLRFL
jgi:hypothetical protein